MSTNVQELQTLEIPFKKLSPWEENVRTTVSTEGIEELTASIRSLGLLQSLVVKKAPHGKFSIVAGKRRFLAISRLVEAGAWPPNSSIPCRLILNGADLTELSLAENVQREVMHPADEFLALWDVRSRYLRPFRSERDSREQETGISSRQTNCA